MWTNICIYIIKTLTGFVKTARPSRIPSRNRICIHCSFLYCTNSGETSSIWSINISSGFVLLLSVCNSSLLIEEDEEKRWRKNKIKQYKCSTQNIYYIPKTNQNIQSVFLKENPSASIIIEQIIFDAAVFFCFLLFVFVFLYSSTLRVKIKIK